MENRSNLLESYRSALTGLPVSRTWRGYGSTIMLEFGALTPERRRDGSEGNPDGELSLMIEWSWRIEEGKQIVCGSWSEDALLESALERLVGRNVVDLTVFGRLPEVLLSLSGDIHVASFMTAEGEPEWALMDHREGGLPTVISQGGAVREE